MDTQKYNGAKFDTRPEEDRKEDIHFEEVVAAAAPVTWTEKAPNEWKRYSVRNQDGSSSCVAQTTAKITEILRLQRDAITTVFSASDIYEDRANKPGEGMLAYDAFNLAARGVATDANMPSQNMSESEMNNAPRSTAALADRSIIQIGKRVDLPAKDINSVASVIQQTGKPVMVFYTFSYNEWTDIPHILGTNAPNGHSITAVDFTLLGQSNVPNNPELWGKKALVIEDSWGKFGQWNGQRLITEDYHKERNFYAGYPMNLKVNDLSYNFTQNLSYGMKASQGVRALQRILQKEGFFPSNIDITGNYLAITADAVLKFQTAHNVAPQSELVPLKGRDVGPKTRAVLNQLYNK